MILFSLRHDSMTYKVSKKRSPYQAPLLGLFLISTTVQVESNIKKPFACSANHKIHLVIRASSTETAVPALLQIARYILQMEEQTNGLKFISYLKFILQRIFLPFFSSMNRLILTFSGLWMIAENFLQASAKDGYGF